MRSLIISLSLMLYCITGVIAQDKGYKNGWFGPFNQHPVVEVNKQQSDTVSLVKSSFFWSTEKNSSYNVKDDVSCHVGLVVEKIGNDAPMYYLNLYVLSTRFGHLSIFKDSPLLIKLSDDSIIRLKCKDDADDSVGEVMSVRYNVVRYSVFPLYAVSSEDIERFAIGIKKIRIEVNSEKRDFLFKRYKNDEVGNFLYQAKAVITEALNQQTDFEEGF